MRSRNSPLTDDAIVSLLGLSDVRIGRHASESDDRDFWIQSIWRARILPSFDSDAFLVVATCAEPWQPGVEPSTGIWARCRDLLGRPSTPPTIQWRKAILSLQGEPTVVELPHDPVAVALRDMDLFEAYEYSTLDGISYEFEIQTWSLHASLSFGNPEVPSLHRLAKALLGVGREIGRVSCSKAVAEYLKVWTRYVA